MTKKKTTRTNPKEAFGSLKPSFYILPPTAIRQCAAAMENGAKKYGPYNWRQGDKLKATIYLDAMFRHLLEYAERKDVDKDSGLHPLAHLMANCAVVLDAIETGQLEDDRPSKPEPALKFYPGIDKIIKDTKRYVYKPDTELADILQERSYRQAFGLCTDCGYARETQAHKLCCEQEEK